MIYIHSQSSPKEVGEYTGLHQIIAPQNTKKNDPRSCAGATAETEPSYKYWRNMKFIIDVDWPVWQTVTSSLEDDEVSFIAYVIVPVRQFRALGHVCPPKFVIALPAEKFFFCGRHFSFTIFICYEHEAWFSWCNLMKDTSYHTSCRVTESLHKSAFCLICVLTLGQRWWWPITA